MAARPHGYGWIKDQYDPRDFKLQLLLPAISLPGQVDLRAFDAPIFDQGQLGSCTANEATALMYFLARKQGLYPDLLSRLFVYYNERNAMDTTRYDSGATIRASMKAISKYGACPEVQWPYEIGKFTKRAPKACYITAVQRRIADYRRLDRTNIALMQCLVAGYPFVFGFVVYESFEDEQVWRYGIVPMPTVGEEILGGHAVMCVGYTYIDSKLYYIIRNSWGSDWGDHGYCFMPAEFVTSKSCSDFWTSTGIITPA